MYFWTFIYWYNILVLCHLNDAIYINSGDRALIMYGHGWWNSRRDQSGINHIFLNYTRYYVFENLATYTRDAMYIDHNGTALNEAIINCFIMDIVHGGLHYLHGTQLFAAHWYVATNTTLVMELG